MKRRLLLVFLCLILAMCSGCSSNNKIELTADGEYYIAGYGSEYKVYAFEQLKNLEVHSFGETDTCSTYLLVEADDGDGHGLCYGSFTIYNIAGYSLVAISSGGFLLSNGEGDALFIAAEDAHSPQNSRGVKMSEEIPEEEWFYPSSIVEYSRR